MCTVRHMPNIITFSRVALTLIFGYSILQDEYIIAIIIFGAICVTDLADGTVARAMGACTRFGAYIDVTADLIYVLSALIVFNIKGLAPKWFTALVLIKFMEFAITSFVLKTGSRSESPWEFDSIGRCFSVQVFVLPGILCLTVLFQADFVYFQYFFLIPACVLATASSIARIGRCIMSVKSRRCSYRG